MTTEGDEDLNNFSKNESVNKEIFETITDDIFK